MGSNFIRNSNDKQILRCYRGKNGYIITGFNPIITSTSVSLYFYLKSLLGVTSSNIAIDIYGIYRDNSTRISNANIRTITYSTNSYPSTLYRIN